MKEIAYSELKTINLNILESVDSFCRINNIYYSLGYGSLLGAVRHEGFIPWDDDIDIIMIRDDYEKFVSHFNEESERYKVASFYSDRSFHYPFAKIYDVKTIKDELGYKKYGVGIDLFPIDKIPSVENVERKILKIQNLLWSMMLLKSLRWKEERSLCKNALLSFCRLILSAFPYSFFNSMMDRYSKKYCNMTHNFRYACLVGPYGIKEVMPTPVFEEYIRMRFEDKDYLCLKNYDIYLSNLYGDYMKLPPINERKTHHNFKAFWID